MFYLRVCAYVRVCVSGQRQREHTVKAVGTWRKLLSRTPAGVCHSAVKRVEAGNGRHEGRLRRKVPGGCYQKIKALPHGRDITLCECDVPGRAKAFWGAVLFHHGRRMHHLRIKRHQRHEGVPQRKRFQVRLHRRMRHERWQVGGEGKPSEPHDF